jgi:hypothetical protein
MVLINLGNIVNINQTNDIMIVNNNQSQNILFIGSCRIHAFLNYFLNDEYFGKKYNYICILVYIDNMNVLSHTCINNNYILQLIKNSTILVSEYLKNYNYFNSSIESKNNIFQLNAFQKTIFLPNYPDVRLYVKDIIKYGDDNIKNIFKKYLINELTLNDFISCIKEFHDNEINRYCSVIKKSFMPELEDYIKSNIYKLRIAHTINHVSNKLLIEMYSLILNKIFGQPIPENVIKLNNSHEFLNSEGYHTKLTYYDKLALNLEINEKYYNKEESDKYLLSSEIFYKE